MQIKFKKSKGIKRPGHRYEFKIGQNEVANNSNRQNARTMPKSAKHQHRKLH